MMPADPNPNPAILPQVGMLSFFTALFVYPLNEFFIQPMPLKRVYLIAISVCRGPPRPMQHTHPFMPLNHSVPAPPIRAGPALQVSYLGQVLYAMAGHWNSIASMLLGPALMGTVLNPVLVTTYVTRAFGIHKRSPLPRARAPRLLREAPT